MKFLQDLIPLRLYNNKRKIYIPTSEKDKMHGSAIYLMGLNLDQNEAMMHAPFLYSMPKMYKGYYIDRNVMKYIDSEESEEDIPDPIEEAALSEGLVHTDTIKFEFISGVSTMDKRIIERTYKNDNIKWILKQCGIRENPYKVINVYVFRSVSEFEKYFKMPKNTQCYSVSLTNNIYILSPGCYDVNTMDGPYEMYLMNELISCLIKGSYPGINPKCANATAIALSGQLEWLKEKKKIKSFRYVDDNKQHIDNLYMADIIYEIWTTKSKNAMKKFLSGDIEDFRDIAGKRITQTAKDMLPRYTKYYYEEALTAEDKKSLKDSDYGIPSKKKYPMPDEAHVRAAIRMFNHVSKEDEAELAKNIKSKMKKFGVTDVKIGDTNRLSQYITEADISAKKLTVTKENRDNPNDYQSTKGIKLTFFDGKNKIGEASISSLNNNNGFLYDVEVFKKYRGQGYSKAMMEYILSHYKVNELTVEKGNDIALNLYKKFGFKEARRFKENGKDMIDMKIDISITESIIRNKDDTEYNMNRWKPGGNNVLFVVGLSGGGKSTTALEYVDKYDAEYIELDRVEKCYQFYENPRDDRKDEQLIAEWWNTTHSGKPPKKFGSDYNNFLLSCFDFMYKKMRKNKNTLYVVEGIQIITLAHLKYGDTIFSSPLIIKNTSMLTSLYRRVKRDKEFIVNGSSNPIDIFKWYIDQEYSLNFLRKGAKKFNEAVENNLVTVDNIPGLEYDTDGNLMIANHDPDYLDILSITSEFSKEEFDRVSLFPIYKFSPWVDKRIVIKDTNEYPMGFLEVNHFPSNPKIGFITTGVSKAYRGHNLSFIMLTHMLESGYPEENGIEAFIWQVHPGNEASERVALKAGFVKLNNKLDKFGRYTYVYYRIHPEDESVVVSDIINNENGIMFNESSGLLFTEADAKYNTKFRRYLYKERLKNTKSVMDIYTQVKARNRDITRTFRTLDKYKGINIWVDTSYYHDIYLKNAPKGNKKLMYMYFDFLNRLMNNEDINRTYDKITYFFPVQYYGEAKTPDAMFDWNLELHPISVIIGLLRKDPDQLKQWANKDIVFIGSKGYFKVDFSKFTIKQMPRFKRNITRLLTATGELVDDEIEDPDIESSQSNPKAVASATMDYISDRVGIDLSKVSNISSGINHLSLEKSTPSLISDTGSDAIFIIGANSQSVLATINNEKALRSKDINIYYKPKK